MNKDLMATSLLTVAFAFASLAAAPASAQLRADEPMVLSARADDGPAEDEAASIDAFRRRYHGQRRPMVALFWNRELSDRIAQSVVQRQSVEGSKHESANESSTQTGKQVVRQETTSQTTDVMSFSTMEPIRAGLDERAESRLRSAFLSTLASGGLKLIDRSMMVRSAAAKSASAVDAQNIETRALEGQAKYLLEVLLIRDEQAPLGFGFQLSVKDVTSAAIVFSDYTNALPTQRTRVRWVAVNGSQGFERAAPSPPTLDQIGRQLALTVMSHLASAW